MTRLTEALFSMQCSFVAKNAAAWAADLLTLPERYDTESDPHTVARFTDEMRGRLDRLDEWCGRKLPNEPGTTLLTPNPDGPSTGCLAGVVAMSADVESKRVLRLHFDHEVTNDDRARLIALHNAAINSIAPQLLHQQQTAQRRER